MIKLGVKTRASARSGAPLLSLFCPPFVRDSHDDTRWCCGRAAAYKPTMNGGKGGYEPAASKQIWLVLRAFFGSFCSALPRQSKKRSGHIPAVLPPSLPSLWHSKKAVETLASFGLVMSRGDFVVLTRPDGSVRLNRRGGAAMRSVL